MSDNDTFEQILAQVAAAPEIEPALHLPIGETINDRFVVEKELGRGGMGRVYLAHDKQLERKVAIKLLTGFATDDALERLLDEARAMAALSHPNVVAVHEVGRVGDQMFLAMEHMPGGSLRSLAAADTGADDLVARFIEAGRGLDAAHREGLVHRDFKPDNVLIGRDGRACVADFGLARTEAETKSGRLAKGSPAHRDGSSGYSSGTPAYMAPEQIDGGSVDARSDQFSFCVALWEALAKELPFKGIERERVPALPSAIPTAVRPVLARGLSLDPDKRYPSMAALLEELEPSDKGDPVKVILVAAIGAVAVASAAIVYFGRNAAGPSCDVLADKTVWTETRQQAVRGAFEKSGLAFAPGVLRRIEVLVPQRLTSLREHREGACQAAHKSGLMSEKTYERATICFDDVQRRLDAQVAIWERADEAAIKGAVDSIRELPSAERCRDARYLVGLPDGPEPEVAAKVDQLRLQIAKLAAARRSGQLEEAETLGDQLIAEAEKVGYAPLLAEALLHRGALYRTRSKPKLAEETLRRGYVAAQEGEASVVQAEITLELAYALAIGGADAEKAKLWRDLLDVEANKGTGGPMIEFKALDALGAIDDFQGNYKGALAYREKAHALAKTELAGDALVMARAERNVATTWHALGKLKKAAEGYKKAYDILEAEVGPDHPNRARLLDNAGLVTGELGDTERAVELLDEAARIERLVYGERAVEVGYTLLNTGVAYHYAEDYDKAISFYEQALDIVAGALGESHPDVALVQNSLGVAYEGKGEFDKAVSWQRQALEVVRAKNENHPDVARVIANIGEVQRKGGLLEDALASFNDAVARWQKLGDEGPNLVHPLTGLGETLIALGRKREAKAVLERAVALAGEGSTTEKERAEKALAMTE